MEPAGTTNDTTEQAASHCRLGPVGDRPRTRPLYASDWLAVASLGAALVFASVGSAAAPSVFAQHTRTSADSVRTIPQGSVLLHLNDPGPEGAMLAMQVGTWTVTETAWSKAGAKPVVQARLVANRLMVGDLLEETLSAPSGQAILRRDFITFNRVVQRWEYMSFDTRAQVGMMTAQSYGPEQAGRIELLFQPLSLPGGSSVPGDLAVTGQMVRIRQVIIRQSVDHIIKDQYFTLADGIGGEWLAHRYDSVRTH